ncbi:MAG: hypothetical protein KKE77_08360 [Alphaproteobacteria bacterium]|jgi:hypothetical protein|nr:hypothetical protein [Alphaproteobacteria bacterium]MBU2033227.1 hypothetical protein [Alphaproteobacteria bacterium]MBU2341238.1 hypothetical protein [Alphaproteobacteria bacterium]
MEYEIGDDPQGEKDENLGDRDGGIVEDHSALKNQSSVEAEEYPAKDRRNQSLVNKKD